MADVMLVMFGVAPLVLPFAATSGDAAANGFTKCKSVWKVGVSPSEVSLPATGSATLTVTISVNCGLAPPVKLRLSGLPGPRVTPSFSPNPVRMTQATYPAVASTLTLTSSNAKRHNGILLHVTAVPVGGGHVRSAGPVTLNVS